MTDLSPAEQTVMDRFDAAPDAPEALRERVAEAMQEHSAFTEDRESDGYWLTCTCAEWDDRVNTAGGKLTGSLSRWRLHRADAAIAVITGGQS